MRLLQKQAHQLHCVIKEIWDSLYQTKQPNIIEAQEVQESLNFNKCYFKIFYITAILHISFFVVQ